MEEGRKEAEGRDRKEGQKERRKERTNMKGREEFREGDGGRNERCVMAREVPSTLGACIMD